MKYHLEWEGNDVLNFCLNCQKQTADPLLYIYNFTCLYKFLNSIITACGSVGTPISDMRSDRSQNGGGDDFTDVSQEKLGALVHTIWS